MFPDAVPTQTISLPVLVPGAPIHSPLPKWKAPSAISRTLPLPTSMGLFIHPPLPKEFKAMSAASQRHPVSITFACAACVDPLFAWQLITGYEWKLCAPLPQNDAGSSTRVHGKSYISGITCALLICSFEMGRARTAAFW
jgi:hypothetical protein